MFMLPELMDCKGEIEDRLLMANDSFEIGMVLAESILLEDLSQIY